MLMHRLLGAAEAGRVAAAALNTFYTDLPIWTANPQPEFGGEGVKLRSGSGIRGWDALLRPRISGAA